MTYRNLEKQRGYQREWMADRRRAWLAGQGPCVRCGSSDRLEVDHIDPVTKVHHRVWSWSEPRRTEELAKCQVLCRACHQKKTGGELSRSFPERHRHGTRSRYEAGCRCDLCRAEYPKHRAKMRARRALAQQNRNGA